MFHFAVYASKYVRALVAFYGAAVSPSIRQQMLRVRLQENVSIERVFQIYNKSVAIILDFKL